MLILSEDALASGTVTVKDMATGEQKRVARADLLRDFGGSREHN